MVPLLLIFSFNLIFFATFLSRFFLASIPCATAFLVFFPSYLHLMSVPCMQFSSKSFDNDTTKYYISPPDLNSEPNTEVDKCEPRLGTCMGTAICFDYRSN